MNNLLLFVLVAILAYLFVSPKEHMGSQADKNQGVFFIFGIVLLFVISAVFSGGSLPGVRRK